MIPNVNEAFFPPMEGGRALDVGPGDGEFAFALRRAGYQTAVVDTDEDLIGAIRSNPDAEGIETHVADARKMPFANASFDRALIIEVLEHIEGSDEVLAELHRVLKPGARLCAAIPTAYTERIYWRIHPDYARNATHVRIFEKAELREALERAGFRVLGVETKNLLWALAWYVHAILRTRADHTGQVLENRWVDRVGLFVFKVLRATPILRQLKNGLERIHGKSWYFYCERA